MMSRESIRFLADVAARPLATTVTRYQRLNLSRRKGNAVRQDLDVHGLIEPVPIATRSGQVMLYQLTDAGREMCRQLHIDPGLKMRPSLEHRFWCRKAANYFENKSYEITFEHSVKGNGAVDVLAERPGEKVAVEVETGKSDVQQNIEKIRNKGFDRIVLVATSPAAVTACQSAMDDVDRQDGPRAELLTWLDVS